MNLTTTSIIEDYNMGKVTIQKQDKQKESCLSESRNTREISAYDAMLPKNDPKFLTPIRSWEKRMGFVTPLRWVNVILIVLYHLVTLVWFLYNATMGLWPKWQTWIFGLLVGGISGFGVTAGVHRYWCHRSYKAKKPLQLILLFCYSVSGQNTIFEWVRDHRVHHKYSETAADPHDVTRGFWFSHVGWLMMKKHPEVLRAGRAIDMTDILRDPLVAMHTRYFLPLKVLFCFVIPTVLPVVCWSESWDQAVVSQLFVRYILSLNFTWAVNSFAHIWGNKPYDKYIKPTENWCVSMVAMGEGWHNYHHTFPWDYKAAELAYCLNFTTFVLDLFAKIGWAYDMKEASPKLIKDVSQKRGELRFIADTSGI